MRIELRTGAARAAAWRRRWRLWPILATGGVIALYAAGAFAPRAPVGDDLGIRRFQTCEITDDCAVGERFVMDADGLRAIRLRPTVVGTVQGRVRIELRALADEGRVIRAGDVPVSELAAAGAYRFAFAPIAGSRGKTYSLTVSSSPAAPAQGVALWATRGDRLAAAALLLEGRERWADLAFQTEASQRLPPPLPLPNLRRWNVRLALAALAAVWLVVLMTVRGIGSSREEFTST